MPRYRTAYPPEFRRQMVDLVRSGRTPEELAREFEPTAGEAHWTRLQFAGRVLPLAARCVGACGVAAAKATAPSSRLRQNRTCRTAAAAA
jgi:transposase